MEYYFKNKTHEEMSELNKMLKYFGCLRCLVLIAKHSQLNLSVKNELIAMQRKELMPFIEEAKLLFKKANEYFN